MAAMKNATATPSQTTQAPPSPKEAHYNRHKSGVECWDLFDLLPSNIAVALKYLWRADHKGQRERDLKKAADHLRRHIYLIRAAVPQQKPPMVLMGMAEQVSLHEPDDTHLFEMLGIVGLAPIDGFPERRLRQLVDALEGELARSPRTGGLAVTQDRPFLGRSSLGLPRGWEWPREAVQRPVEGRQRERLPPPPFWLRDPEKRRAYASVMAECYRWGVEVVCEPEPPPGWRVARGDWGGLLMRQGELARVWFPPGCRYTLGPALLLKLLADAVVGPAGVLAFMHEVGQRRRLPVWRKWTMHHYFLPTGASWANATEMARVGALSMSRSVCMGAGVLDAKGKPTYQRRGPGGP